jgi:hypothetical protein
MRIEKTADGWIVEPSTSEELKALAFFFEALNERYGGLSTTREDSSQANHLQTSGQNQHTASSG